MDQEMMEQRLPHLPNEVVADALGYKLGAYLVALEGWRRGLKLKWYTAEADGPEHVKTVGKNFHGRIYSLSSEERTHYFFRSRGDKVDDEMVDICKNKDETKRRLAEAGVPVPQGKEFDAAAPDEELAAYAAELGFPVVLKPTNGSLGKGVYSNIRNETELRNALQDMREQFSYTSYIVETYLPGEEYRMLTVGDKVVAVCNRVPANVTGDGKSTIRELIDLKNEAKKQNPILSTKPIKIDYEIKTYVDYHGYTLDSVPPEGERLFLRKVSNGSAGGDLWDATDELTPEVKQIAVDALQAMPGLGHAGVDVIVNPEDDTKGTVIEINTTPEIGAHPFPTKGLARDVPAAIVDYYFPETAGKEKSPFYFDFESVLEPLRTRTAKEVEVAPAPTGQVYARRFILDGDVQKPGYHRWIRKQALKKNLHGETKMLKSGKLAVLIAGTNPETVDNFRSVFTRDSGQANVKGIKEKEWNKPVKIGFEVKKKKESKASEKEWKEQLKKAEAEKEAIIEKFKEELKGERREVLKLKKRRKKMKQKQ